MRPLGRRRVIAGAAGLALAGCARPDAARRRLAVAPGLPRRAEVAGVPLIRQSRFHCGPAALAMVLGWSGLEVTEAEIAARSFTPGARGTFLADMAGAVRRRGRLAVELRRPGHLFDEVSAGHPVIVFQDMGVRLARVWHYGVVTGYDLGARTVMLHSGARARLVMPLPDFLRSWDRGGNWAMVALRPGDLPASGDEVAVLKAAAALEEAGRHTEAAAAYRAGAKRWPRNWLWPFGLGNALFAQGNISGARAAWRQALARDPSAAPPRRNLAALG